MPEQEYAVMLAAARPIERATFRNEPLKSARLPSLFEDGVFDSSQQVLPVSSQTTYGNRPAAGQAAEFTAFQFQR
jgi:hypothetical protein